MNMNESFCRESVIPLSFFDSSACFVVRNSVNL
jgi:hypothetical protein